MPDSALEAVLILGTGLLGCAQQALSPGPPHWASTGISVKGEEPNSGNAPSEVLGSDSSHRRATGGQVRTQLFQASAEFSDHASPTLASFQRGRGDLRGRSQVQTSPRPTRSGGPQLRRSWHKGTGQRPSLPCGHHVPRWLPAGRQWTVAVPWKDQGMRLRVAAEGYPMQSLSALSPPTQWGHVWGP